jgi:hypothetical protein
VLGLGALSRDQLAELQYHVEHCQRVAHRQADSHVGMADRNALVGILRVVLLAKKIDEPLANGLESNTDFGALLALA